MEAINQVRKTPSKLFRCNSEASKRLGISEEEVEDLKASLLDLNTFEPSRNVIETIKSEKDGNKYTVATERPMNKDELTKFLGLDGISSYIKQYWAMPNKRKDGLIPYSILVACNPSFLSKESLTQILRDCLPTLPKPTLTTPRSFSESMKHLSISDIHAGAIVRDSIYEVEYTESVLLDRMNKIVEAILDTSSKHEVLRIANLGDQLDGFNGETTRGGHKLGSDTNKRQFQIYIKAMSTLISDLALSGKFAKIEVINVDNSNHSGNGFSFIANEALRYWAKDYKVDVINRDERMFHESYGNHNLIYTHGKDDSHMKKALPFKLTDSAEKHISGYIRHYGLEKGVNHLIKGDLHQYGDEYGSCFRYMNVPSLMGSNDYSESNFGLTKAGCVIEEYSKNSNRVLREVLRF